MCVVIMLIDKTDVNSCAHKPSFSRPGVYHLATYVLHMSESSSTYLDKLWLPKPQKNLNNKILCKYLDYSIDLRNLQGTGNGSRELTCLLYKYVTI